MEGFGDFAAGGEFELGGLADAEVAVGEELGEFGDFAVGHAGGEEFFQLGFGGAVDLFGIENAVDAAGIGEAVGASPVGEVDIAVGAEFDVGDAGVADEIGAVDDDVGSAARFGGVGDGALGEVDGDEVVVVAGGEAGAGVEGEAGGALSAVSGIGEDVVDVAFPDFFLHPGAEAGHELVGVAPAEIGVFDDVHDAGFVGSAGVVVVGPEVAEVVEGEFLGVAEAGGEDFEVAAVEVAAEDGAGVDGVEDFAFFGDDVGAAVADAEVEFSVGADGEAVEIVSADADVDAVAGVEDFAFGGGAVFVVGEAPEVGDVGEPELAVAGEDAGGGAGDGLVEAVGENFGVVGAAVAVAVFDEADDFGIFGEDFDFPGVFLGEEFGAVFDGFEGGVGVFPVLGGGPDVENGFFVAVGFGDEEAALFVDGEGDGVEELGVGGEDVDFEAGGELDVFQREFRGVEIGVLGGERGGCEGSEGENGRGGKETDLAPHRGARFGV